MSPFSTSHKHWVGRWRQDVIAAGLARDLRGGDCARFAQQGLLALWAAPTWGEGGNAGADRKPGSVEDNHSSGTAVTNCLKQPTRESARDRRCGKPRTPLFGLAPGGVYRAASCYQSRGALLPHLFTLTDKSAVYFLWHCPWARAPQVLPGALSEGARTFLCNSTSYSDCLANSSISGRDSTGNTWQEFAARCARWSTGGCGRGDVRPK